MCDCGVLLLCAGMLEEKWQKWQEKERSVRYVPQRSTYSAFSVFLEKKKRVLAYSK